MDSPDHVVAGTTANRLPSIMWLWSWVIPVAAAVGLYAPALNGSLVWDDGIVQKDQLVAFRTLHDVFFFPKDIPQWGMAYYRPMVTLSYLADQGLFGRSEKVGPNAAVRPLAEVGPHASVILFHVLTTFFVWLLARQILRQSRFGEWGALVASVIFAAHPIHTESVCWITGRSDTVAAMFLIPALVTALHYRDRCSIWALLLSPVLFLAAILSKEVALSGVLVLPLLLFLVPSPETSPLAPARTLISGWGRAEAYVRARMYWLPLLGLYAVATLAYFLLRKMAGLDDTSLRAPAWGEAFSRAGTALAYYLIKVVVPPPQSAFPTDLPSDNVTGLVLGATLVLLVVSFWLWRRGTPLLLLCLGWVLLTLPLPLVAAARLIAKTPVAERSLYVPSVGLCVLVGGLFCAGWSRRVWRGAALVLTLGLAGVYGIWTYGRGQVWQDNVALWSDVTSHNPASGTPFHELGQAYYRKFQTDKAGHYREKAVECFEKAIERYPSAEGRGLAWNSKGVVLMSLNPDEAEQAFRKSIEERPTYATPYFNLGLTTMNRATREFTAKRKCNLQLFAEAQAAFEAAIRYNARYTWAYLELGKCHFARAACVLQTGDREQSRAAFLDARTNFEHVCKSDPYSGHAKEAAAMLDEVNVQLKKLRP